MGRTTCDNKEGLKKGPWTPVEDEKLKAYIQKHGCERWKSVPQRAGLLRCGKSCRLRWSNYLRPGIRRGNFSLQEDQTIVQLHAVLGNKWSVIATYLDQRTDNEVKNHWNTHLKKRLLKMGIDPSTHKSIATAISGQSECTHKTQWESARLQAEARLRKSSYKLDLHLQYQFPSPSYTKDTTSPFDQHKAMSLSSTVPYANQVSPVVIGSNTDNSYEDVGSSAAAPLDYNCSNMGVKSDPCSLDDIEDYWHKILDCINSLKDQPK